MSEMRGPRRLREKPPRWQRREEDEEPAAGQRWDRELEAFEEGAIAELYPGALVMEDLAGSSDEQAMLRILARYTVLRLQLLSAAGVIAGTALRVERRVALEHLHMLPREDWERRALERLARLCGETPDPEIVGAIFISAEAAAKRGHAMGAFALYRSAYELSLSREWWDAAAHSARGIAQLARMEEARRSERLWDKRGYVLERRAEQAAAETAADAADPGAMFEDGQGRPHDAEERESGG